MSERETILSRLKKIQALAESGVAGEQENAQRMLLELQEKYGCSLEELASENTNWVKYKGKLEQQLLNHVVMAICRTKIVTNAPGNRGEHQFKLTLVQAADVAGAYEHYRTALETDMGDAFAAFLNRHHLFAPREDGADERPEPTGEEMARAMRIMKLMGGMGSHSWQRRHLIEA